jgi:hypothetical protein
MALRITDAMMTLEPMTVTFQNATQLPVDRIAPHQRLPGLRLPGLVHGGILGGDIVHFLLLLLQVSLRRLLLGLHFPRVEGGPVHCASAT